MLGKVFQNGRSQAIRIPKELRVKTDEVLIEKVGDTLIIKPKTNNRWDKFFDELDSVDTSDFLDNRTQPQLQDRELF
jgi:antitoxin VapB